MIATHFKNKCAFTGAIFYQHFCISFEITLFKFYSFFYKCVFVTEYLLLLSHENEMLFEFKFVICLVLVIIDHCCCCVSSFIFFFFCFSPLFICTHTINKFVQLCNSLLTESISYCILNWMNNAVNYSFSTG